MTQKNLKRLYIGSVVSFASFYTFNIGFPGINEAIFSLSLIGVVSLFVGIYLFSDN